MHSKFGSKVMFDTVFRCVCVCVQVVYGCVHVQVVYGCVHVQDVCVGWGCMCGGGVCMV